MWQKVVTVLIDCGFRRDSTAHDQAPTERLATGITWIRWRLKEKWKNSMIKSSSMK